MKRKVRIAGWSATVVLTMAGLVVLAHRLIVPRPRPTGRPNVVFITVDTLRADHTPFGGYERDTMPKTRLFFRGGIFFTQTETVRTETTPAYASMLTGLHPYRHGVRNLYSVLPEEVTTLPERLAEQGYRTAAFVSSSAMKSRLSGLGQGFHLYEDSAGEREPNRTAYERIASRTVAQTLDWLRAVPKGEPFFLFLHLIDPHGPYHPPQPFSEMFHSSEQRSLRQQDIPRYQYLHPALDLHRYIDLYDGEIAYVDHELERLYRAFHEMDLMGETWFLFTADHGESLGEDGFYLSHGQTCYERESRVPMAWLPPSRWRADYVSGDLGEVASLVDVTPTVLDLLGVAVTETLDGESLASRMRGAAAGGSIRHIERVRGHRHVFAARDSRLKLVLTVTKRKSRTELFDLAKDPGEIRNLLPMRTPPPELREALEKYRRDSETTVLPFPVKTFSPAERMQDTPEGTGEEPNLLSAEEREELRALGYAR